MHKILAIGVWAFPTLKELTFGFWSVFEWGWVLARWFRVLGKELWTAVCRAICRSSKASSVGRRTWGCCPDRSRTFPPSSTWPPPRETFRSKAEEPDWRFPTWKINHVLMIATYIKLNIFKCLFELTEWSFDSDSFDDV